MFCGWNAFFVLPSPSCRHGLSERRFDASIAAARPTGAPALSPRRPARSQRLPLGLARRLSPEPTALTLHPPVHQPRSRSTLTLLPSARSPHCPAHIQQLLLDRVLERFGGQLPPAGSGDGDDGMQPEQGGGAQRPAEAAGGAGDGLPGPSGSSDGAGPSAGSSSRGADAKPGSPGAGSSGGGGGAPAAAGGDEAGAAAAPPAWQPPPGLDLPPEKHVDVLQVGRMHPQPIIDFISLGAGGLLRADALPVQCQGIGPPCRRRRPLLPCPAMHICWHRPAATAQHPTRAALPCVAPAQASLGAKHWPAFDYFLDATSCEFGCRESS